MLAGRRFAWLFLGCAALALSGCGGGKNPTSPTATALSIAGTWDVAFNGTLVQRNDGGPVGGSQTDSFVMSLQQSGTSIAGALIGSEGRPDEVRVPFTGTLTGNRLDYRIATTLGNCAVTIQAETTVSAAGDNFTGTQTQSTCEGRAEGRVNGTKRRT